MEKEEGADAAAAAAAAAAGTTVSVALSLRPHCELQPDNTHAQTTRNAS